MCGVPVMNSKQRRIQKRERLVFVEILGEIADNIESGKETPAQVAAEIRQIQAEVKRNLK